ncbi:glycosyltransferase family 2 protein [Pseudaminobacter arsenicus]|uniref:Glycosyltransferase family 2 protein n=1 Tax=Borborobacter arsenicus TaxID=1851146 RepID=A0A432V865_9HYPH|nr:glycosyltransferase family 2 protein [Pseudaminobacter arsenicus]RUM98349.1 glycosyltransferase family 2 protein [Pseudaminobacter arsenicus]
MSPETGPDVSVVIAAFNAQDTLARAVDSALRQEGVAVEVVVIDDCSTDGTLEIARSFAPAAVRVVALERNRGPGGARNAGLEAARGRFVVVLDADDKMHPQRLTRMIGRAEEKSAQIAVDNIEVVQEEGGTSAAMFPHEMLEGMPELSLAGFIAANLMFEETFSFGYMKPIFERAFIERHGLRYDTGLRIGEDYIFLASALAEGGRCVVEPQALYAYHVRAGSISRVLELHHVEAMLEADAALMQRYRLEGAALAAQSRRTRSLERAASFLALVGHLKDRAALKALGTAWRDPAALRHLRMPIAARLSRLARPFAGQAR